MRLTIVGTYMMCSQLSTSFVSAFSHTPAKYCNDTQTQWTRRLFQFYAFRNVNKFLYGIVNQSSFAIWSVFLIYMCRAIHAEIIHGIQIEKFNINFSVSIWNWMAFLHVPSRTVSILSASTIFQCMNSNWHTVSISTVSENVFYIVYI